MGLSLLAKGQTNTPTTPSIRLKAYERVFVSGVAPSPVIEVGGKETKVQVIPTKPVYYIYLIANKVPYIKIERIWIKQQLYTATITKVASKPVLIENGKQKDTLVRYTDEAVWQISIKDKVTNAATKSKKDIANKVAANELVLRLNDKNGCVYTRVAKTFTKLEPAPGM
ncbi:MAG: hypothetical protein B7Y69_08225 [Sphingobacteriia bacterium 35-40-8]|nr:MAG: hypothetical protein B7Y69_08225 [Sphingobacteriia bacterium 35-40-8]